MHPHGTLSVLLLQARDQDDPMRPEEVGSFLARTGLAREQLHTHDLLSGPPRVRDVLSHDTMMIGGSGDYYVSRNDLPDQHGTLEVLGEIAERGHPTFASCFGFQLMVNALGGEIVQDADAMEIGTVEIRLTEQGESDPLLGTLPPVFWAQAGRKDRATRLSSRLTHLASSRLCPFHAARVPGQPVWATQFHPELTGEENRQRFLRYLDGYGAYMSKEELEATLKTFRPSPETEGLLPRFLNLVFD